jgi:diguanylate cyclase (GGDEF)-like protein/PAS domain S-box-containing protein
MYTGMDGNARRGEDEPIDARALLGHLSGVLAVVDETGTVTWVNDAVTEIAGYQPSEVVGRSMLDFLDVDWNPHALESIGYAMDHDGPGLPTLLRFRVKDGEPIVMEATANNQFTDPAVRGLIAQLRPCTEQHLVDQILESLASGDPLDTTFKRIHGAAASETLRSDATIILHGPGSDRHGSVAAATPGCAVLASSSDPDHPWSRAARSGEPVVLADLEELPGLARASAEAGGYQACWAYPVPRHGTVEVAAVLVLWRREPGPPEPASRMMAERLVKLVGLALERHDHGSALLHAARHDPLTQLVNRSEFFESVEQELGRAQDPVGVLYLDLDGFKLVNDRHGHAHGDAVLRAVAERLAATVRPGDLVGRLGGDEFGVCCPAARAPELARIADRLLAVVPEPIVVGGTALHVGATIGLAAAEPGACSADELIAAADAALLAAKAGAKGTRRQGDVPDA